MTAAIRLGDVVNFFEYEKVREDRRRIAPHAGCI